MATTNSKTTTPPVPANDEASTESEPAPVAGYVTIERDGVSACVDAKSVPELEVQGWQVAN